MVYIICVRAHAYTRKSRALQILTLLLIKICVTWLYDNAKNFLLLIILRVTKYYRKLCAISMPTCRREWLAASTARLESVKSRYFFSLCSCLTISTIENSVLATFRDGEEFSPRFSQPWELKLRALFSPVAFRVLQVQRDSEVLFR